MLRKVNSILQIQFLSQLTQNFEFLVSVLKLFLTLLMLITLLLHLNNLIILIQIWTIIFYATLCSIASDQAQLNQKIKNKHNKIIVACNTFLIAFQLIFDDNLWIQLIFAMICLFSCGHLVYLQYAGFLKAQNTQKPSERKEQGENGGQIISNDI